MHAPANRRETDQPAHRPRRPERRRRRSFRLVDRRSGFERRGAENTRAATAALLYLREHPRLVLELLLIVNLLSILDLTMTHRILALGAIEVNPLMAYLLAEDVTGAAAVKIALVGLGTLGIWLLRRRRPALQAALLLLVVFGLVVVYQSALLASLL
jgi:hypothetical protein